MALTQYWGPPPQWADHVMPINISLTQGAEMSVMSVDGFDWHRCSGNCPVNHYDAKVRHDVQHDGASEM